MLPEFFQASFTGCRLQGQHPLVTTFYLPPRKCRPLTAAEGCWWICSRMTSRKRTRVCVPLPVSKRTSQGASAGVQLEGVAVVAQILMISSPRVTWIHRWEYFISHSFLRTRTKLSLQMSWHEKSKLVVSSLNDGRTTTPKCWCKSILFVFKLFQLQLT